MQGRSHYANASELSSGLVGRCSRSVKRAFLVTSSPDATETGGRTM